jgi:hypothetical protein
VGAEVGAAECEQGADNVSGDGMDAAEACESCATKDVGQHGFGLIVSGVGYCNFGGVASSDELIEEGVAGAAGGVFQISLVALCTCGDVGSTCVERQIVFRSQRSDEFFVGVGRAAAKLMIEVGHADRNAEFCAQLEQQIQKRDGIRAAGNRDGYAIARGEEFLSANMLQQPA